MASPLIEEMRNEGLTKTPGWLVNRLIATFCSVSVLVHLSGLKG